MLFKKKKAPSFDQPQPSQPSFRQPPPPTTSSPSQGSQINQPKPLSSDQLQHLQQFIQHAYQAVTDYEYLYEKVPTEHTAHTIRGIIDDNKKHYQTLLHLYRKQANKDPEVTEAMLNRNAYTPALKKAFEQEQQYTHLFEEAARLSDNRQLRDIYTSIARDHQRHALWFLSYLTIYTNDKT
ncbi:MULTISPECIES: ferritin-like domain-containing protein [Shouchella]|uniref:Ferritin-like domain-containing protein n=2 Tax=Shouchella TaxID=2893057 RepID=A0ABY7W6F3_9BACI|nr:MULTISPECIES: ferritin-like domain-containing protein [Shouchella]MED4126789.1 ferritin-like domain-containing protein [Shouchella miscanthi]WDF04520.1 ferritin-like domain-containing protein [Shouchella hunanensis]